MSTSTTAGADATATATNNAQTSDSAPNTVHQFSSISLGGQMVERVGNLKMNRDAIAWQSKGGKQEAVIGKDIRTAHWIPIGRYYQLKLGIKGGSSIKFDGFRQQDFEFMSKFVPDSYGVELQRDAVSMKGWNWGKLDVTGGVLKFDVENEPLFELPLSEVDNCALPKGVRGNKNEVSVEMHQSANTGNADVLVEMRLYVPAAGGALPDENDDDAADDDDEPSPAAVLCETIIAQGDLSGAGGRNRAVAVFSEVPVVTPRNKFDIELYAKYFQLVSNSRTFKIMYTHVSRFVLLTKPDGKHFVFVISVDPPIMQGHTTYPHIVMHLERDNEVDVPINLDDKALSEQFAELRDGLTGKMFEVLPKLFTTLVRKKITMPGSFKSATIGHEVEETVTDADGIAKTVRRSILSNAIRCTYKNQGGLLYPLEQSFFYVYKPPMYVRHDEIAAIEFSRVSKDNSATSTRNFDIIFNLKNGDTLQFGNIQRAEFKPFFKFVSDKGIKIINLDGEVATPRAAYAPDDDDDDMADDSDSEDASFEDKGVQEEVSEEFATPDQSGDGSADDDASVSPTDVKSDKERAADKSAKKKAAKRALSAAGSDGASPKKPKTEPE